MASTGDFLIVAGPGKWDLAMAHYDQQIKEFRFKLPRQSDPQEIWLAVHSSLWDDDSGISYVLEGAVAEVRPTTAGALLPIIPLFFRACYRTDNRTGLIQFRDSPE